MFERILVNLDGSAESEAVLPIVEKLVSANPTEVILLRVAPHPAYVEVTSDYAAKYGYDVGNPLLTQEPYSVTEHDAVSYLETIANRLRQVGATAYVEFSFNEPVMEILDVVKRYKVDLIAMATHGRTGLNRLLRGSITERVLHQAPCPMLIVRTPGTQPQNAPDADEEFDGIPRS